MWSHEIDDGSDGSGDGDSPVPENVSCPACERASGIWDARHVFNAYAIYELPFGSTSAGSRSPGPCGPSPVGSGTPCEMQFALRLEF
jgi:hypothetical protein